MLWFKPTLDPAPAYVYPIRGIPSTRLPGRKRNYMPWEPGWYLSQAVQRCEDGCLLRVGLALALNVKVLPHNPSDEPRQ